mmetsp:Transcript_10307/g.21649  ORF Transcript_10307/g.21649 Transcript_10307/m.21649 type:complete len:119 (-) Transcript_10307:156-512(-)
MVFGGKNSIAPTGHGGNEDKTLLVPRDPSWPGRIAAMNVYYSQRYYYKQNNGTYAASIDQLDGLLDDKIVRPFEISTKLVSGGFKATVSGNPDGSVVTITNDRLLQVISSSEDRLVTT